MSILIALFVLSQQGFQAERDLQIGLRSEWINVPTAFLPNANCSYAFATSYRRVMRINLQSADKDLEGELLIAATFKGPLIRTSTMSQQIEPLEKMTGVGLTQTAAFPLAALSKSELFVQTVSQGFGPQQKQHVFGLSLVRFDKRGPNPNIDFLFPKDYYAWYHVLDWQVNEKERSAEFLVARTPEKSPHELRFELYSFKSETFSARKSSGGPYAKFFGKKLVIPELNPPRDSMTRAFPGSRRLLCATPSGIVAAHIGKGKVAVWRNFGARKVLDLRAPMGIVDNLFFLQNTLYIDGRPLRTDQGFRWKSYTIDPETMNLNFLGHYRIAGVSPNGDCAVIQDSASQKYFFAKSQ